MAQKTILIMAGGTGGHIFPGLAVAEVLGARGWRVCWMGVKSGMEAEIVPRSGYEMVWVDFQGVRGKGPMALLLLPMRLLHAFWQALEGLRRIRPDVVLGMGGYIAFPGGMMAALLGRPLAIHEQNAVAGTTTRILAHLADRVLTSFECAFAPARRALMTGNPIRAQFAGVAPPQERLAGRQGRLRLTVLGGSLGAKALNDAVPLALAAMRADERPEVVHQTGRQHVEAVAATYRNLGIEAKAVAFVDDMASRLAWSDLVICRAGATTLAEIAAVGVASVLVPFPYAIDDHQTRNAQHLAESDAALLLPQRQLDPERLAGLLRGLDQARLLQLAGNARKLGRPEAAQEVAAVCEQLAAGSRRAN